METIDVSTRSRTEMIDINKQVAACVRKSGVKNGLCFLYVPHTTAAVTVNEGADPSVKRDVLETLNELIPFEADYSHTEGNSAAHIKSTVVGVSEVVPVRDGAPMLGTWQTIFFCEFDGPRRRKVHVVVSASD
ncbi:MAG: YjbQ family protein [Candidatus Eiseniibacteriota bacterium]|nr:MAG: YjbQ family protein [Candidatus Eisenbacteria bacterium]